MKIVKTQSRWKLYKHGFPVALRFDNYNEARNSNVENWCKEHLGQEVWMWEGNWHKKGSWATQWGKSTNAGRPYFVGFRDPGIITTLVLTLGLPVEKSANIFG